jgi:hypothetical protein
MMADNRGIKYSFADVRVELIGEDGFQFDFSNHQDAILSSRALPPSSITLTELGWSRISESRPDFIEFLNTSPNFSIEHFSNGDVRISGDGLAIRETYGSASVTRASVPMPACRRT